jgi:FkbM family methyltransferase
MNKLELAKSVVCALRKHVNGVPGEPRSPLRNLTNACKVLSYLLARQVGITLQPSLSLGHAGRLQRWSIEDRSDLSALEEVFLDREYALEIRPPRVVFDLGANFGAASVYFAQAWPEATIIAVEPSPAVFRRLVQTTSAYPRIHCINCAVGGQNGSAEFVISSMPLGSSLFRRDPAGSVVEVEVRTLRSLMEQYAIQHIDFLKFDVEGAEEAVFRDSSLLERIGSLVGEVHKDLLEAPLAQFIDIFSGYDVTRRTETDDLLIMSAVRRAA